MADTQKALETAVVSAKEALRLATDALGLSQAVYTRVECAYGEAQAALAAAQVDDDA